MQLHQPQLRRVVRRSVTVAKPTNFTGITIPATLYDLDPAPPNSLEAPPPLPILPIPAALALALRNQGRWCCCFTAPKCVSVPHVITQQQYVSQYALFQAWLCICVKVCRAIRDCLYPSGLKDICRLVVLPKYKATTHGLVQSQPELF